MEVNMRKSLYLLALLLLVTACASSGNKEIFGYNQESIKDKIAKGYSKAQVRSNFGSPKDIHYTDSANEIWKYEFLDLKSKPINFIPIVNLIKQGYEGQKYLLAVFYNDKGIVEKYSYSVSDHEMNSGIAGGGSR